MSDDVGFHVVCASEDDTDRLGQDLARVLRPGLTIGLNGDLGAGKTRFVRALCMGLGIRSDAVTSPTFVLMQLYTGGRLPVAHFDTYRLGDVDEFVAIGAEEYLHSDEWLCVVEWADRVAEVLPRDRLTIIASHVSEHSRRFEFFASGAKSLAVMDSLVLLRRMDQMSSSG